jgi:hypothetical protein
VLLSGCWVSCCRTMLRRFWLTNSVHVTVAFELSPAVCPPADGIQSSLRMRCPSVCISKRTVACSTSSSDHAKHLSTSQMSAGTRSFVVVIAPTMRTYDRTVPRGGTGARVTTMPTLPVASRSTVPRAFCRLQGSRSVASMRVCGVSRGLYSSL